MLGLGTWVCESVIYAVRDTGGMWQILGEEALYVEFADVFRKRVTELASEMEDGQRFVDYMKDTEVTHLFNGGTETHAFTIRPDASLTPEDIQYMSDIILAIAKADLDRYFVSLDGNYQKCIVNIRTDEEPELIGKNRTDGYGSGKIYNQIIDSLSKPGRANDSMI